MSWPPLEPVLSTTCASSLAASPVVAVHSGFAGLRSGYGAVLGAVCSGSLSFLECSTLLEPAVSSLGDFLLNTSGGLVWYLVQVSRLLPEVPVAN